MSNENQASENSRPLFTRWRASIRAKITLPYVLLAVALALAGSYVVTRLLVDSIQERFINQLIESGRLVADRLVEIEDENLAVLRTVAHTVGLDEALLQEDQEALNRLVFPIAVNEGAEAVEILDRDGRSLISLRHRVGGGVADYDAAPNTISWSDHPFVARVLAEEVDQAGDKYAGLIEAPWGTTLYAAGPVYQGDELVGAVLVGRYLETLPNDLRQASAAHHVTLYTVEGRPLVSSFNDLSPLALSAEQAAQVLNEQDVAVLPRSVPFRGQEYSQVLGPLEVRGGVDIGLFSAALAQSYLVRAAPITQLQLVLLIAAAFLAIVLVGTLVARRISRPIVEMAAASRQIARGDLNQRVAVHSRDEVGDLAAAFNDMALELRHAQRVRDLFGRAVSREVSQVLIDAVRRGNIAMAGENRIVTTLFTDIRGFTSLMEQWTAQEMVAMLNEVLGTFIQVIEKHGGVVNKFGGDSLLAIFGAPMPQPDHPQRAVEAGLEMLLRLDWLNERRRERDLVPIEVGIGINTGEVVAGPMGSPERLEYTVIGDAVNVTARVQGLAREFEGRTLFVTAATLQSLDESVSLELEDLGEMPLRGKAEPVHVYAVLGGKEEQPIESLEERQTVR